MNQDKSLHQGLILYLHWLQKWVNLSEETAEQPNTPEPL